MIVEKLAKSATAVLAGVAVTASVTAGVTSPDHRVKTLATPVTLTATVLAMAGLGWETVDPSVIRQTMGGYFADPTEYNVIGLPWPGQMAPWNGTLTLGQSVAVGLETMDEAVQDTPGQKYVLGASGATIVVDQEMTLLADRLAAGDPDAPQPSDITFVVMGDANRGIFKGFQGINLPIFDYVPDVPVTPYNVIVIKGEYDGIGDWPDRWWNVLADLNALAGTGLLQQIIPEDIVDKYHLDDWGSVHKDAMFADLDDVPAKDITTTTNKLGGVTTTYLIPTDDLPLLRPLAGMGVPQNIIDTLEKVLKPIVDSAYVRNDRGVGSGAPRPATLASQTPAASRAAGIGSSKRTSTTKNTANPTAAKSTSPSRGTSTHAKSSRRAG